MNKEELCEIIRAVDNEAREMGLRGHDSGAFFIEKLTISLLGQIGQDSFVDTPEFNHTEYIGALKSILKEFVSDRFGLSATDKERALNVIGDNWYDDRFSVERELVPNGVHLAIHKWMDDNHELAKLWKETALNASKISSEPHEVASKVVSEFKKRFRLEEE